VGVPRPGLHRLNLNHSITAVLAFIASGFLMWWAIFSIVGAPGAMKGPWGLDAMSGLKKMEWSVYGSVVVGLPVLCLLLVWIVDIIPSLLERLSRHPFPRTRRFLWVSFLPWALVPVFLHFVSFSFYVAVLAPFLAATLIFFFLISRDLWGPRLAAVEMVAMPHQGVDSKSQQEEAKIRAEWVRVSYKIFITVLIPLALFLIVFPSAVNDRLEPSDEGLRMAAVNQFQHGKRAYKDIYFQYGPGIEIVQPLLSFSIFGNSLWAHRQLVRWVYSLGVVAIYGVCLMALEGSPLVLLFPLLLLGRPDFQVTTRGIFLYVALTFLLARRQGQGGRRNQGIFWTEVLAGFFMGLSFFYSMESGLLALPAILLTYGLMWAKARLFHRDLCRNIQREAASFFGGLFLCVLPVTLWLAIYGSFLSFVENTFLVGSTLLSAWGKPTPVLFDPLLSFVKNPGELFNPAAVWVRWWFPVLLCVSVVTKELWALFYAPAEPPRRTLLYLSISGLFLFVIALGRSDYDHWLKATPLLWILLLALIQGGFRCGVKIWRQWKEKNFLAGLGPVADIFLAGILLFYLVYFIRPHMLTGSMASLSEEKFQLVWFPLQDPALTRLGGIQLPPDQVKKVGKLVKKILAYGGKTGGFYSFTDDSLVYYLTDTVNPTRFANVSYVVGDKMEAEVLRDLEQCPPRVVLALNDKGGTFFKPYHARLKDYFIRNYRIVERDGDYVFLLRKTLAGN